MLGSGAGVGGELVRNAKLTIESIAPQKKTADRCLQREGAPGWRRTAVDLSTGRRAGSSRPSRPGDSGTRQRRCYPQLL